MKRNSGMEISRDLYLNKLLAKRHNKLIKVITGLRRCGKSYLLFNLFRDRLLSENVPENHILEIAFDLYENKKYRSPEAFLPYIKEQIADSAPYYILLDEIQLLDEFEAVLNSLARLRNVDIYVTGSNAKFLSKDIITEFRGRGDEIHMYPLTFAEFMSVYSGDRVSAWSEYVLYGGIPLVLEQTSPEQKAEFLKRLFSKTYLSDIIGRNRIKNKIELEEILNILSSAIGSLTNPTKLSAAFKSIKNKTLSPNTVKKYIECLEDSFLIDSASRYDIKGKRYIGAPLKYYFGDLGLRNARLNFRQIEENHAMENIIFNELKARGYNVDIGIIVSNETDRSGKKIRKQLEIDFVCNKGSKRFYIQSALTLPDQAKREQEQRSLLKTDDAFKKIIVTKDALAPLYNEKGILTMNIFDFLLNPNSLDF